MRSVERQTLIALKARRTAFRIVTDFLHLADFDHKHFCERCGKPIPQNVEPSMQDFCPRCDREALEVIEMERQRQEDLKIERDEHDYKTRKVVFIIAATLVLVGLLIALLTWGR
jgi:uncharacterized membrane protein YvbJ